MPFGFWFCQQPLGRLLTRLDYQQTQKPCSFLNGPLSWLLGRIKDNAIMKQVINIFKFYPSYSITVFWRLIRNLFTSRFTFMIGYFFMSHRIYTIASSKFPVRE